MVYIKTFGRTTILANYSEQELLNMTPQALDNAIIEILTNSQIIHNQNKVETRYLLDYYYGDQDIKYKVKHTRENINNKTTENWAYAIVDFKKAYLLGEAIQYTQKDDSSGEEITKLNQYVSYEDKDEKDKEIYEEMLVVGRGFRYTNKDNKGQEDETPFESINCPIENTEVVYSSNLGNEQLFSYIVVPMQYLGVKTENNGEQVTVPIPYETITVYLRNKILKFNNKYGTYKREGEEIPLLWDEHVITEYPLNRKRISLVELGKDLFDDLNYVESLDKDDFEQYVNAIMVFKNVEVTETDIAQIKDLGAVCINSTDTKKADVDLLQGQLNAQNTQIYYNRLKTALFQILGVPIASDTGGVESGDTGKAKMVGQGFATSGIRIKNDMTAFRKSDRNALKVILKICRETKDSGITKLKVSDINTQFLIDKSENLLVKTQALETLYSCDIPREFANSIVDLFSDSNAVTKAQKEQFGEQVSRQGSSEKETNLSGIPINNKINNQNNKIDNILEKNNQGQ